MSVTSPPRWLVHIPTVDTTCVRLACARRGEADPWPLSRVIADLISAGAERAGRPHAAGAGRGIPLIHRQELRWRGCAVLLEAHHAQGGDWDEIALHLPAWMELEEHAECEDAVWDLIDVAAAAAATRFGALGDGEALELGAPSGEHSWAGRLRRHVALLLPAAEATTIHRGTAFSYRTLERAGLRVMLR